MALNFVATSVLSSNNGVDHDTETILESEEAARLRLNAKSGGMKSLHEQLADKQALKDEEYEMNAKALRAPQVGLDEDDLEYFREINENSLKCESIKHNEDENAIDEFIKKQKNIPADGDGDGNGNGNGVDAGIAVSISTLSNDNGITNKDKKKISSSSVAPVVILRKKRKIVDVDVDVDAKTNPDEQKVAQIQDATAAAEVNSNTKLNTNADKDKESIPVANSALSMLGGYCSSDDGDDDNEE